MKHPHNKINTVRINIYVIKLQERIVSLTEPTYYQQYGEREIFSEINLIYRGFSWWQRGIFWKLSSLHFIFKSVLYLLVLFLLFMFLLWYRVNFGKKCSLLLNNHCTERCFLMSLKLSSTFSKSVICDFGNQNKIPYIKIWRR